MFSGYGIASAVLGVIGVLAIALGALIWSDHRDAAHERDYQSRVLAAAADWTGVLINMNIDNVDASLQKLHDGTVGELNSDFDASIKPYREVVKTLQARTTGQIESVAVETVHHDLDTVPGQRPTGAPDAAGGAGRAHRHGAGGRHLGQRERRQQAHDGALEPAPRCLRRRRQADDLAAGVAAMRNLARVLAFDVAAPLVAVAALLGIGVVLGWPLWWVSVCSMLCLLIVEGMLVNFLLYRRDSVTVGTDDDGPGLRLAVVGLATVALAVAVVVGYTRWTLPDRDFNRDSAEVVRIATAVSEATATFTPADPNSSIDRAASFMVPERADAFKDEFGKVHSRFGQAQRLGSGADHLGGARGAGSFGGQRRGDHAGHPESARSATEHGGAGFAGGVVQAERPVAGARRRADQLPMSRA